MSKATLTHAPTLSDEQIDQILDTTADSFATQLRSPIMHAPSEQNLVYEEVTFPGAGNDPTTHVGPVVTKAQQSKVLEYIAVGKREGARVVAEGRLPSDPALASGFFVPPTFLADVPPNARVAQEEIFGPVVTVTTFDTEEDAIAIVNSSEYGLFAGLYTRDSERALRVARRIDVGVVLINNYFRGILGLPFGGTKHSGYGREHTIETLSHFGYRKLIRFPSGTGTWPQWRAVGEIFG